MTSLNRSILLLGKEHKPDLVWAEKQEYLHPQTLEQLSAWGIRSLHFTPDPYFTLAWKRTKLMDSCMTLFDYVLTCKRYELAEYRRVCRKVIYMALGFAPSVHRPVLPLNSMARAGYASDIAFVGGWEPRRETLLDAIAGTGCNLKIWGYAWDHVCDGRRTLRRAFRLAILAGGARYKVARRERLAEALQGGEIYGNEYAYALSGARIGIGFLRRVCPDQHTTRTFEIPACASMLIADRSSEHLEFFKEGNEAEFFESAEELLDKLRFYLRHQAACEKMAYRGYERCWRSGYSYESRLGQALAQIDGFN